MRKHRKTLVLAKEAVRNLRPPQLDRVRGGEGSADCTEKGVTNCAVLGCA